MDDVTKTLIDKYWCPYITDGIPAKKDSSYFIMKHLYMHTLTINTQQMNWLDIFSVATNVLCLFCNLRVSSCSKTISNPAIC